MPEAANTDVTPAPLARIANWYIAENGYRDLAVWRPNPKNPSSPIEVLDEFRADQRLWEFFASILPSLTDAEVAARSEATAASEPAVA